MAELIVFEGGTPAQEVASEMCEAIKKVVFAYADRIPLALAIGVLEIAKIEILSSHEGN